MINDYLIFILAVRRRLLGLRVMLERMLVVFSGIKWLGVVSVSVIFVYCFRVGGVGGYNRVGGELGSYSSRGFVFRLYGRCVCV